MLEPIAVDPDDPHAIRLKEIALALRVEGHIFHSYGPDPTTSSPFAEANSLYPWEKSSDWCREYISAALESALLWADFYMPMGVGPESKVLIRPRPVQGLARSALESASQAVWVMTADDAAALALRHLRLMHTDFDEQRKAYRLHGPERENAAKAQIARFVERAKERGFDIAAVKNNVRYMDTIRAAAEARKLNADAAELAWRLASGATHGKRWAVLDLNAVELLEEYEEGQFRTSRTPLLESMVRAIGLAYDVIAFAVAVYGARRGGDVAAAQAARLAATVEVAKTLPVQPGREAERDAIVKSLETRTART